MSFNTSTNFSWFLQDQVTDLTAGTVVGNGNLVVKLYPSWYEQIAIEWSVPVEFGNCVFNVYSSQTSDGPFEKVNQTPITGTFLLSTDFKEYSKFHNSYYIVEAILLDKGNVTIQSNPTSWATYQRNWVTLRSIEIQRREYILLTKFAGIKSYLFRKKNYGQRCTKCFDYLSNQVTDDNCPTCFGTSFEGGFFAPCPVYVQYETTPNNREKTYFGNLEQNEIGAWTIAYPDFTPDDILVRTGDWNVYSVGRILPTELQGNTVRQVVSLVQLSKIDVEYKLINKQLPDFPQNYTI